MAPTTFYRVVDGTSQSRLDRYGHLLAADSTSYVTFKPRGAEEKENLETEFLNHMDWRNREDTVFISVYSDEEKAWAEAQRRVRAGREKVLILKIDVSKRAPERMEYRNVRKLAAKLGVTIHGRAWHNSHYEYVFLHRTRARAIVRAYLLKRKGTAGMRFVVRVDRLHRRS
jgi:3-deoxy-D-manno-octulosonic-acid transferase